MTRSPDVAPLSSPPPEGASSRAERAIVHLCFLLSGASALIYEVVWMRQLRLSMGATTSAVSTILSVYMGGMAIGAYAFGRLADRSRAPLKLYAYLEAALGVYALLLPTLVSWTTPLYHSLARPFSEQPAMLVAVRAVFGAALLLAPTVLMGGTLPVLVRFVGRSERRFGRDLGTLYGVNLAGAALGSLAAAFVLIPPMGLHGATLVAVAVNLAIGLLALVWSASRRRPAPVAAAAPPDATLPVEPGPALPRALLFTTVFVSGFASLGYEVLWTRVLLFSFSSTVQAFALILATFLTGLALGSVLFAALDRRVDRARALALAQSLAGLLALLLVPASLRATDIMKAFTVGARSGEEAVVGAMALVAGLVILAPATLMGFVFPMASRLLTNDLGRAGQGIGSAYTVNTIGGLLGSLLTGFAMIPLLGLKGSLMALAAVQVAMGWMILSGSGRAATSRLRLAVASGLALLLCFAAAGSLLRGPNPFDDVRPEDIIEHRDGISASVSVVRNPHGGKSLRIDGFEAAAADPRGAYMGMMTHIPMLLHPDPRRLLVICFGTGTTAGAGLLYPETRIDVVDINRNVFEVAQHFRDVNRGVAGDPRVRLIVDDGRNYLQTTRDRYDVITAEPMPPGFAGVTSLYSREYYQLARERLAPGGIIVQWLPFHLVTPGEAASILRTMQDVFPETTLWVHTLTGIVVARRDPPLQIATPRLRARLSDPDLRRDLARFQVPDLEHFVDLFMLGPAGVRHAAGRAALVTDDRPFLEFHAAPYRSSFWAVGGYRATHAESLESVYRLRLPEPLPLAPSADAEALQAARPAQTHALLARLFLDAGFLDHARAEFETGLGLAREPRQRARFLYDLATVAERQGQRSEARRLVGESLALRPDDPLALSLRAAIGL
jgi:spermidine synthase